LIGNRGQCRRFFFACSLYFAQRAVTAMTAQINEALCKVLCHNLCVVIQSVHELEIEPTFLTEAA
jgi:hypothetical protein